MKKNKRIDTLKEILKELSTIPLLFGLLAIIGLVGYLLPDSILKNLPFEVLCVLGVVVILGILYAIAGIVAIIQKNRAKKDKSTKDEKQRSN
ncbi:MAG: hypothetical protein IKW66_00835 [Clostridia bacterium]|nr:hypothetical protein [Clostridia bacterium]